MAPASLSKQLELLHEADAAREVQLEMTRHLLEMHRRKREGANLQVLTPLQLYKLSDIIRHRHHTLSYRLLMAGCHHVDLSLFLSRQFHAITNPVIDQVLYHARKPSF
jgi:hypothetical protein